MIFKTKLIVSLSLIILIGSLMICGNTFPQSIGVELNLPDLREWDKQSQEYPIMKVLIVEQSKTISELEKSLIVEKKTNELNQREIELKDKMLVIKDQEIAAVNRSFDQMKEVADRAIKLAETVKPKSEWYYLIPIVGIIFFALGASL